MKKSYVLISLLISSAFISSMFISCNQIDASSWRLIWEDDFNQTEGFDQSVWSKIPRGGSDWNNFMSDFDSLYSVKDSHLILTGITNNTQKSDTAAYLTGGLYTKGKKSFENGRIEIRAKLESATGAWPAFWLLPEHGSWPNGGEIDIMEHLNHDSITYQTIHTHYTYKLGIKDNPKSGATAKINKDDYNVYAVELYADSISLFVNDIKTLTYPRIVTDKAGQFPFDAPFYLLLDMQLGGSWVGDPSPKELPVSMYIDWVRFYQKEVVGQ